MSLVTSDLRATLADLARRGARLQPATVDPGAAGWPPLLALARAEHVLPLVAAAFEATALPVPDETSRELRTAERAAWAHHLLREGLLGPLLGEARERGIRVVVYKGAAHAARLYARPWQRPMADVDMLVRAADAGRFHDLVRAAGFRVLSNPGRPATGRVSHELTFAADRSPGLMVDVHTTPCSPARHPFDVARLLEAAKPFAVFGATALGLSREEEIVIAAVNRAHDHFRTDLAHAIDGWLLITGAPLGWPRVVELARSVGAATATWLTLVSIRREAGAEIPEAVLAELRPPAHRRLWLGALLDLEGSVRPRFALHRRVEQLLLAYPLLERPSDFARYVVHHGRLRAIDFIEARLRPGAR